MYRLGLQQACGQGPALRLGCYQAGYSAVGTQSAMDANANGPGRVMPPKVQASQNSEGPLDCETVRDLLRCAPRNHCHAQSHRRARASPVPCRTSPHALLVSYMVDRSQDGGSLHSLCRDLNRRHSSVEDWIQTESGLRAACFGNPPAPSNGVRCSRPNIAQYSKDLSRADPWDTFHVVAISRQDSYPSCKQNSKTWARVRLRHSRNLLSKPYLSKYSRRLTPNDVHS